MEEIIEIEGKMSLRTTFMPEAYPKIFKPAAAILETNAKELNAQINAIPGVTQIGGSIGSTPTNLAPTSDIEVLTNP